MTVLSSNARLHRYGVAAITAALTSFSVATAAEVGDVVLIDNFENMDLWSPRNAEWLTHASTEKGGKCVKIAAAGMGDGGAIGNRDVLGHVDKSDSSTFLINRNLTKQFEGLRGYECEVEFGVTGESLPLAPKPWVGMRFSVNYSTPIGSYTDCYYNSLSGSFNWKTLTYRIRVPSDMEQMGLSLGLISPSGSVSFDHIKFTVTDQPFSAKTPPPTVVYKGHDVPRLRGFVTEGALSPLEFRKTILREIGNDWNGNVAKIWFPLKGDIDGVDATLQTWMEEVEALLPVASESGVQLILHIGTGWTSSAHGGNGLFYEKREYADKFVEVWQAIAKRFQSRREIYAFELLNESQVRMPIAEGCPSYLELMERAAQAINAIDAERTIIVQPEEWWGTRAFYKMRPLKAENVVYAVHFYSPFPVSHQGVAEFQSGKTFWEAFAYPGAVDGVAWDRSMLEKELESVREFQRAYNVHIIVSEFSCIRWALGNSRYKLLKDMVDIFEEYEWDWLYHSYSGWHGWDPRFGSDPWERRQSQERTAAENLLRGEMERNIQLRKEPVK